MIKTLGHYQITSQLGKGGMGEVYRAKDSKLGRDVAIKVLPDQFAKDADRVARFQREAKVLASLNHPNIAAIYGLEESSGTTFLVLELVEGDTLADRIKAGPVPVEEALKLALQIAEALEAAHEKGVIHRDLKPANIKVTPDGKVKVLDFGLAKAFAGEQAELNLSNSPTLSNAATQQGVILGTAAYMSPEQAKGKTVDKRADIWAFGVVLFELLTGRQLFSGETVSETLAAVLMREPDFSKLPSNLHPKIIETLERCLEKEAKNRYSGISDARVDIQKALADPCGVFTQPITQLAHRTKLRTILPWVAAAIVLGAIIAGVAVWNLKPVEPRQVMRFSYELPQGQPLGSLTTTQVDVSLDGKQFVYGTPEGLFLRSMDELNAKLIPGTEGDFSSPFFSPDGKWIGFFSNTDRKMKKIATTGGVSTVLCDTNGLLGASWYRNNTIVYGQLDGGIMRVSADGGVPEAIIKTGGYSGFSSFASFPQILPDGRSILYTVGTASTSKIIVQSLKTGEVKNLLTGSGARYLPTGQMVYCEQNNLYAVPLDLNKLEVAGGTVPVVEGVTNVFTPQWAVSDSGTLVYIPGTASSTTYSTRLVWVDRVGKEEAIAAPDGPYFFPRISPDGTRVVLTIGSPGSSDIWIWDFVHKNLTRLTFNASGAPALWTPDGKRIVYTSQRENNVYWKVADGTGTSEPIVSGTGKAIHPWSWSNSGKVLILEELSGTMGNIESLSMDGGRKLKPLLQEKYSERQPQISRNGRWVAYVSNESGKYEVYVRPFPDVDGGRWQVSTNGGANPLWSPDGRELFFRSGDAVMAVPVKTDPTFSFEAPKILFRGTYFYSDRVVGTLWDISPDGKRFLMMKEPGSLSGEGRPRKINIVVNWIEELKQRLPKK
jgi:serine/threonine-protein kinase